MTHIQTFSVAVMAMLVLLSIGIPPVMADGLDQDQKDQIRNILDTLLKATTATDYNLLKDYLANPFSMTGIPEEFSKMVLQKLIVSGKRPIESIEPMEYSREGTNLRVKVKVNMDGEESLSDVLITEDMKFKEINIFKVRAVTQTN